jgi:hypothetical protein
MEFRKALSRRGTRARRSARWAGAGLLYPHGRVDRVHQGRQTPSTGGDNRDALTVGEFVPGYETSLWLGLGAPKNTPAEIVEKLNKEINAGLADSQMKARLAGLGAAALPGSPADFGKLIAEETEKWGKVVKFAGIKAE